MKYCVALKAGLVSLPKWSGEADSPEDARDKALAALDAGSSDLGVKSPVVTEALVVWEIGEGELDMKSFVLKGAEDFKKAAEGMLGKKVVFSEDKPKKDPNWPFKHLKKKSEWPMQSLVVGVAGAVLKSPKEQRSEMAHKFVERFFRVGARLAREFEVNPVKALKVAQKQIEREIPGAKAAIAEAKAAECSDVMALADDLLSGLGKAPEQSGESSAQ